MPACYDRTYNADIQDVSAQLVLNGAADNEEPTNSTFDITFSANFDVTTAPTHYGQFSMRQASKVNLPYVVRWYIDRGIGADSGPTDTGRSITINASPNTSQVSSAAASATQESITAGIDVGGVTAQLTAGDKVCWSVYLTDTNAGASQAQGVMKANGTVVSGSGQRSREGCTLVAVDKPYFRVYGGDVIAGSPALNGEVCNPTLGAGILAWNRNSKPTTPLYNSVGPNGPYGGAGTQLAAFALGAITDFASATTRGSKPTVPKGLSFANDSGTYTNGYGGNWDATNIACGSDYFIGAPTSPNLGASQSLNGMTSGAYRAGGPLTITGGNIQKKKKIAIYSTGDIAITGDINFPPSAINLTDITELPSLRIITKGGNIYIAPGVHNIDAVLVAQSSSGTGGTIYTCSDGGFGLPSNDQYNSKTLGLNGCRTNRLTITGAVVAQRLRLLRSLGSIRMSDNSEGPGDNSIAETIIYTPAVWLANPPVLPPFHEPYEAFTSLPPVL
jgi:hypothetical protein